MWGTSECYIFRAAWSLSDKDDWFTEIVIFYGSFQNVAIFLIFTIKIYVSRWRAVRFGRVRPVYACLFCPYKYELWSVTKFSYFVEYTRLKAVLFALPVWQA